MLLFDSCLTLRFWYENLRPQRPERLLAVPLVYRGSFHGEAYSEGQSRQDRGPGER